MAVQVRYVELADAGGVEVAGLAADVFQPDDRIVPTVNRVQQSQAHPVRVVQSQRRSHQAPQPSAAQKDNVQVGHTGVIGHRSEPA